MHSSLRTRAIALLVLGGAALLGFAACGQAGGGGSAANVSTSVPASTSFRTIPVTSTTSTTQAPPPAAQGVAQGGGGGKSDADTYVVRAGDAWPLIAKRVKRPLDQLLSYNGAIATTPIYTGDKIRIPPEQGAATTPSSGATAAASTPEQTAPAGFVLHTVKFGDTWVGIARKYGVKWQDVMTANGAEASLTKPAPLTVGSQIKVPKAAG